MCGRYSLTADLGELALRFEFGGDRLTFEPATTSLLPRTC